MIEIDIALAERAHAKQAAIAEFLPVVLAMAESFTEEAIVTPVEIRSLQSLEVTEVQLPKEPTIEEPELPRTPVFRLNEIFETFVHPEPIDMSAIDASDGSTWMRAGSCRGTDPSLFFPPAQADQIEAIAFCRGCVVIEPCLEFALMYREDHGIWGGTTEEERRHIIKRRKSS